MDPILFVLLSSPSRMTSAVCVGSVLVPVRSADCSYSGIKAGLDYNKAVKRRDAAEESPSQRPDNKNALCGLMQVKCFVKMFGDLGA